MFLSLKKREISFLRRGIRNGFIPSREERVEPDNIGENDNKYQRYLHVLIVNIEDDELRRQYSYFCTSEASKTRHTHTVPHTRGGWEARTDMPFPSNCSRLLEGPNVCRQ
jgi:hypothetical protein